MGRIIRLTDFDVWAAIQEPVSWNVLRDSEMSIVLEGPWSLEVRSAQLHEAVENLEGSRFRRVLAFRKAWVLGQLSMEGFTDLIARDKVGRPFDELRAELCRLVGTPSPESSGRPIVFYLSYTGDADCGPDDAEWERTLNRLVAEITGLNSWAVTGQVVVAPIGMISGPWKRCALINLQRESRATARTLYWPNLVPAVLEQAHNLCALASCF